jgi:hypothetical protein
MEADKTRNHFWQPLQRGSERDESYAAALYRDADHRAEEAQALLDRAEQLVGVEQRAVLLDTADLLYYAKTRTPGLIVAEQRLRRLLG